MTTTPITIAVDPGSADAYEDLLREKITFDSACGFEIAATDVNPTLFPHQNDIVRWAVHGGRRAIFAAFGLGKSVIQIEVCRIIKEHEGSNARALIVCPLGVRQEFRHDAEMLGLTTKFVRTDAEIDDDVDIHLTNYESVRLGKLDPGRFTVVSLDEAAILRSIGTDTYQQFSRLCKNVPYRFVATATPSPNEYTELKNYADFLGVMDGGQVLTRFFQRDSNKAGHLTLHETRTDEFWSWMATWSVWVQRPSDLGHSDDGYDLPPLDVQWHEIEIDALAHMSHETDGQGVLVKTGALGVMGAAAEKRSTIDQRVAKAMTLHGDGQFVVWVDLNDEQRAVEKALTERGVTWSSIYGSLPADESERRLEEWRDRHTTALIAKPVMLGSGVNLQQAHCAIFLGVTYKFAATIQAVHRQQRFGQTEQCVAHFIHADTERSVVAELRRKWEQHRKTTSTMSDLIQEQGLTVAAMSEALARTIGTEPVTATGEGWEIVCDDTVRATRRMADDSVDMIWSSPPYGSLYEYSTHVEDFGHNGDDNTNRSFWAQMDHLTVELMRVLEPGRMCIFHVKDRIQFGNMNGRDYATVQPFSAETIMHMTGHGFGFVGEIVLDTDVVRENNTTNRLTYKRMRADRTAMGVGLTERLLLFRKQHTDRSRAMADVPVTHSPEEYSLARWQIDAAGKWKSNGDGFITPKEMEGLPVPQLMRLFRDATRERIYDYEAHVRLGESMAARGRLPTTFALLNPDTNNPNVWTGADRLHNLNANQAHKKAEKHVCPSPWDIVDRCINQWSNPGELIFDPFGGLGTTVYRALALGRRGRCHELNERYWADAVKYAQAMDNKVNMPSLFDLLDHEADMALS